MIIVHYLAYGSNLHPFRLAERVPSAQLVRVVPMPGKRLAFHKKSQDSSGKCMFYSPGGVDDIMYGALYQFDLAEKGRLDELEGKGKGYNEAIVAFPLNGMTYDPFVYVAATTHIAPSLAPYNWYKEMVLLGAHFHGLPAEYIATIAANLSMPDPDPVRVGEKEEILRNMRQMNFAKGCWAG